MLRDKVSDGFCSVRLWTGYELGCSPKLKGDGPAFCLEGKALTRDFMVARPEEVMFSCRAVLGLCSRRSDRRTS